MPGVDLDSLSRFRIVCIVALRIAVGHGGRLGRRLRLLRVRRLEADAEGTAVSPARQGPSWRCETFFIRDVHRGVMEGDARPTLPRTCH